MFNIGPEGPLTPHSAHSQFEEQIFLRAGRVSRGPARRRRSQLFLASCGSLITAQRSRRAARKMLIHQDLERWGLRRRERESADQSEATWDGALNTCVADHSRSHNPPFLLQIASQCSRDTHSVLITGVLISTSRLPSISVYSRDTRWAGWLAKRPGVRWSDLDVQVKQINTLMTLQSACAHVQKRTQMWIRPRVQPKPTMYRGATDTKPVSRKHGILWSAAVVTVFTFNRAHGMQRSGSLSAEKVTSLERWFPNRQRKNTSWRACDSAMCSAAGRAACKRDCLCHPDWHSDSAKTCARH